MDQTIGIEYTVRGLENILNSFRQVEQGALRIQERFSGFSKYGDMLKPLNRDLYSLTGAFSRVETAASPLREVTSMATTAEQRIRSLTNATREYARALNQIPQFPRGGVPPMGPGGPGGVMPPGGGIIGPGGIDKATRRDMYGMVPWFMLRWTAYSKALEGAHWMASAATGASRVDTDQALAELSAVSFSRSQKYLTEQAGQAYARRIPSVSTIDYIKAMSQTASAFSVKELGLPILQQMNESSIMMAKMSKMPVEQAAEMQSKLLNAYLAAQPGNVYKAIQSGGRANLPGFGEVNLGEMSKKYMAMTTKAVEISNVWGKGIMDYMQYAGPVLAQNKWDPAAMLAWVGSMVDVGFKGQKAGRAHKDLFIRAPETYAKMELFTEGKLLRSGASREERLLQEEEIRRRGTRIAGLMQDFPKFGDYLKKFVGPAMEIAQRTRTTPGYGLQMQKEFGLSKDFLPQFLAHATGGFVERLMDQYRQISAANPETEAEKLLGSVDSVGHGWLRFTRSLKTLSDEMGKSEGIMARIVAGADRVTSALADSYRKENRVDDLMKNLEPWRQKYGGGASLWKEDYGMGWSSQQPFDKINAWMKEQYGSRLKTLQGDYPGKELGPNRFMEYAARANELWNQVMEEGQAGWAAIAQKATEPETVDFRAGVVDFGSAVATFMDGVEKFLRGLGPDAPQKEPSGPPPYEAPPPEQLTPGNEFVPPINLTVQIGDREVRAIVREAMAEMNMENRNRWGNRMT